MKVNLFVHAVSSLLAGLVLCCSALPGQTVQLRDGSILVGEIQEPDGEGFTLLRTDNGGVLQLRWGHLTQSSAKLIKTSYGLLDTSDEEVTVRADVVQYVSSTGKPLEALGIIVERTPTEIRVRKGRDVTPIRRTDIRGLSERQVTPFEIYTKEDYYNSLVAEIGPAEDADKHLALGEKLMRVRDYPRAEQHMLKAQILGGGRQPKVLEKRIEHLKFLKGAAAEQELLDAIRTWTNRGNFPLAKEKIEEFKTKFANSKLTGELERLERIYDKVRANKLVRRTAELWYKYIGLLANRKVSEPKVTLAMVKQYAERDMGKEIREQIAESLGTTIDEVEDFWTRRFDVRGAAASQHFYYSLGSWVLGEEAVLKDTRQGEAEKKEREAGQSAEDKKLQEGIKRIQEALKRARQARQRRGNANKQKKEMTPEDWWKQADRNLRTTWLKAYYAEFAGDLKMIGAYLSACPTCTATGRIAFSGSSGGANQFVDCPTCHKTRFKRDFRAK